MTDRLRARLVELQAAMEQAQLWQVNVVSEQALQSQQPFCLDTLTLAQWLQFVLIPRFHELLDAHAPLPERLAITPYAQEVFKGLDQDTRALELAIEAIDQLFEG
jgi:uncharacterized protein YqcC (DUF446 family)